MSARIWHRRRKLNGLGTLIVLTGIVLAASLSVGAGYLYSWLQEQHWGQQ